MKYVSALGVLALALLLISALAVIILVVKEPEISPVSVLENVALSIMTASLTAAMFDILTQSVEQRRWLAERLRDLASSDAGFASRALDQLREQGLLESNVLCAKDLRRSNLSGLSLRNAHVEQSNLDNGRFIETDFRDAKLNGSSFRGSDLSRAQFSRTMLRGCDFREAVLDGAEFDNADCTGAEFANASLQNVNWNNCIGRPHD
ncbi:MAG: pentapeptide repeat-containing protein [Rhizobiaceae bacterium]